MIKVRIKKVPKARTGYQVQGSLANDVPAMGGADYNTYIGMPKPQISKYITAVPREEANLEAEGGETVYGDINGDGLPEHKIIKGPRHSNGGVPLNLPDDTFIYSDFRGMSIKDPEILANFGKNTKGKKSYTPATLAKQYDIDKYRKILQDPNSDSIDVKTAELMIANFNKKLAALALAQESKKGFPQGIPAVAKPYMTENKLEETVFIDPSIKQLRNQVEQKLSKSEQQNANETDNSNTELEDEEQAQEMNQGQPIAMPEQQFGGMFMGGFDFPYTGLPEAQYGKSHSNKNPYKSQVNSVNTLGITNKQLNSQDAKSNRAFNSYTRIIDDYDDGTPSDTSYMYVTPTENVFFSTAVNPETKQKFGQRQSNDKFSQLTPEERSYYQNKITQELGKKQYGGMSMEEYDLPEAEYGMAMGANPRNYMGRPKSPMYARGGALRTYQGDKGASTTGATGGANPSGDVLDISGMDAEQARRAHYMWKRKNPDKEPSITKDGKKMKYKAPDPKKEVSMDNLKAVNAAGQKFLETELKNPKSKIRAELIKQAQEAYKNANTAGKTGLSKYRKDKKSLTEDEIINGILNGKKRNDAIKEAGIDTQFLNNQGTAFATFEDLKSRGLVNNQKEYDEKFNEYKSKKWDSKDNIAKTLGIKMPTPQETLAEQAGAHGFARMNLEKAKGTYNNFSDDEIYNLDTILGREKSRETNTGAADESEMAKLYGDNYATLSPIDGYAGNSHLGQGINPNMDGGTYEEEAEKVQENVEEGKDPQEPSEEEEVTEVKEPGVEQPEPEMWLQDKLKIAGAAVDLFSAKKYMPMGAARVDLQAPKPTFMDPTRELAANAEQANIQTAGMAQFAGPQALSARSSSIQGQGAKNAADVLAKYNNQNVGIANQFEQANASVNNQEAAMNQANQLKLYDQNTIANQQFDNTKRALRGNLLNQYTTGITNKYKTDALNQIYPQMKVDAGAGGKVYYDPSKAKQIKPTTSKTIGQYIADCKKDGLTDEKSIMECAKLKQQSDGSSAGNNDAEAYQAQFGQMKNGGFVYSDIVFPFIL